MPRKSINPRSVRVEIKLIDGQPYVRITPSLMAKSGLGVGPCYATEVGGVLQVTAGKAELAIPVLTGGDFGFNVDDRHD